MKTGRNERCPCGSGKKYKKCHGFNSEPFTIQESAEQVQRVFSRRVCLHPESTDGNKGCSGPIAKAHTIQRGGGLTKIAKDGHVLTARPKSLLDMMANKGRVRMRSVGVREASTFTGFCAKHDENTFAPLERKSFSGTAEQAFLLYYRTVCHEMYLKQAHLESLAIVEDQARRQRQKPPHELLNFCRQGATAGLRDLQTLKERLDHILLSRDFAVKVECIVCDIEGTPDLLCAGATAPEVDLAGNELQDLSKINAWMETIGFSLIATDKGGAAVFTWIYGDVAPRKFAESMMSVPLESLATTLVHISFEYFENTFVSPVWWDGLPMARRQELLTKARTLVEHHPETLLPVTPLPLSWKVTGVRQGGAFASHPAAG